MGRQLITLCHKCGYEPQGISLGGTMSTHLTYQRLPAMNTETNEVETVNYFKFIQCIAYEKTLHKIKPMLEHPC